MQLTKQDLHEWNQNPITRAIFEEIERSKKDMSERSPIRDTADQTAMQASYNNGWIEGVAALEDAYREVLEESE